MGKLDQILHGLMLGSILTISGIGAYYHLRRENAEKETEKFSKEVSEILHEGMNKVVEKKSKSPV